MGNFNRSVLHGRFAVVLLAGWILVVVAAFPASVQAEKASDLPVDQDIALYTFATHQGL